MADVAWPSGGAGDSASPVALGGIATCSRPRAPPDVGAPPAPVGKHEPPCLSAAIFFFGGVGSFLKADPSVSPAPARKSSLY